MAFTNKAIHDVSLTFTKQFDFQPTKINDVEFFHVHFKILIGLHFYEKLYKIFKIYSSYVMTP